MINKIVWLALLLIISGCALLPNKTPPDRMVYIPAGRFILGASEADGRLGIEIGLDEVPRQKVYLSGFFIDKYETTNREYKEFLSATGYRPPLYWFTPQYLPYKIEDNFPAGGIAWGDADRYCRWRGKRLPTEEEWEKAARGTDGRLYPWGDAHDNKKCNAGIRNKYGLYWSLPVDSLSEGQSPYGVYNMCGNVEEWTASWHKPYKGNTLPAGRYLSTSKVRRGASYASAFRVITDRSPEKYTITGNHIGIRCAKD